MTVEAEGLRNREQIAQESVRKLQRQVRDFKEDLLTQNQREADILAKKAESDQHAEACSVESAQVKSDLKLALQRIEDLQSAMQGEMDSDTSDIDR